MNDFAKKTFDYWRDEATLERWIPSQRGKQHREEIPVSRFVPDCDTLLDVGCGSGRYVNVLAGVYSRYVGVDQSPQLVEYCRKLYDQEFIVADAVCLPFRDRAFDLALCIGVLRHNTVPNVRRIIAEMTRVADRVVVEYLQSREPVVSRRLLKLGVIDQSFKTGFVTEEFARHGFVEVDHINLDPYWEEFRTCERRVSLFERGKG